MSTQTLDAAARSELLPASALPAAYYAFAHVGFGLALAALVIDPSLPGLSFYHPRMVALVHLVTLAWISGSILGSFYIVGPLALRVPMVVRPADWIAYGSFVAGTIGMVAHFWLGTYDGMGWSAGLVTASILRVGWLAVRGLPRSTAPPAVLLHVALAFFNIVSAAILGILIGFDRTRGFLGISPLAATFAHAHLAAVGWATMMIVGLSYRLIPMMMPAAMPTGRSLALSAILIESGLAVVVAALLVASTWVPLGAILITAGLVSFVIQIRGALKHRMPRPPALPRRDWSTWQTHAAFAWLLVAVGLGIALSAGAGGESRLTLMWMYGVAGLIGFIAQIVTGIQGRLVPLYAWYRAFAAAGGPPQRSANELPSARFAAAIFAAWTAGVPLLAWGLAGARQPFIATGAAFLLAGICLGAAYLAHMLRGAGRAT